MGLFNQINKQNRQYIKDLSDDRAAGTLGMSDAQKDAQINRSTEAAGAQTQAAIQQAAQAGLAGSPGQAQALFQGATSGLQNAATQASANADLASEQQAANRAAELAAQEQALFQRRKENREYVTNLTGQALEVASMAGMACWVAVALWGERSPRTRLARLWVNTHDNAFTRAYKRHGPTWARWVERSRLARAAAWLIWSVLARLGRRQLFIELRCATQIEVR